VVLPGVSQAGGQKIAKVQHPQKFVEEVDTTEVGQTPMITGDSYGSRRIAHFRNS
jgi:hypothetical protein